MRVVAVILGIVGGYGIGAVLGFTAITMLSANTHDRSLEAAMTSAFVAGPLGAIIGVIFALGFNRAKRRT